jgi:alpha-mannosidase
MPLRVHMVANAHIDPVWIWDWHEGMHEVLQTFRAALERLAEHPDLVFTASSAAYYEWVQRTDPELFARVAAAVAEGRWIVAGGQWVEPDCNLPSGESMCRQLLYGQRYLAAQLGRPARVGWNVDTFGHAANLPQLLRRAGLEAYVMMRPGESEMELPAPLFEWRAADGTGLPTYRIPFDYSTRDGPEEETIRTRAARLLEEEGPRMLFFGVGDHGGGPTRRALRTIDALAGEHPGDLGYSDPHAYFAAVAAAATAPPVVEGELQHHAVGCYSAHPPTKRANARAESLLRTAETMAEICRRATGRDLGVQAAIEDAWRGVLFAQFHDAIGGTCTEAAYPALDDMQAHACAVADRITTLAAHAVVQQVDTWTDGAETAEGMESAIEGLPVPMVVFNPLSHPVRTLVSIPHPIAGAHADDGAGEARVQQVSSGEVTYSPTRAAVEVEVPPLGWRCYWLRALAPAPADPAREAADATAGEGELRTTGVRCRVEDGAVSELLDGAGTGWLGAGGIVPVVLADPSDTWSHGVVRYEGEELPLHLESAGVVERGPARATQRLRFTWGRSSVVEEVSVHAGQPFLEIRLDVDWHDALHLLKLVVPLARPAERHTAGALYGQVERASSGGEEVMSHWVGAGGLAITADHTYAYDCDGRRVRLTVLRSPRFADHGMGWADDSSPVTGQGRHRCSFRIHPGAGAAAAARAQDHCVELPLVLDSWHRGPLGPSRQGAAADPGVALGVVKRAEDGRGAVVRAWETAGRGCEAHLDLPLYRRTYAATWRPHEVKTIYLPDDPQAPPTEIDIPELRSPA